MRRRAPIARRMREKHADADPRRSLAPPRCGRVYTVETGRLPLVSRNGCADLRRPANVCPRPALRRQGAHVATAIAALDRKSLHGDDRETGSLHSVSPERSPARRVVSGLGSERGQGKGKTPRNLPRSRSPLRRARVSRGPDSMGRASGIRPEGNRARHCRPGGMLRMACCRRNSVASLSAENPDCSDSAATALRQFDNCRIGKIALRGTGPGRDSDFDPYRAFGRKEGREPHPPAGKETPDTGVCTAWRGSALQGFLSQREPRRCRNP